MALLGRGHPWAWIVTDHGSRRTRKARIGTLIQQSPAAAACRQHAASRSRATLLRDDGRNCRGRVQTKCPPAMPDGSDGSPGPAATLCVRYRPNLARHDLIGFAFAQPLDVVRVLHSIAITINNFAQ